MVWHQSGPIAEVKAGDYGTVTPAPAADLPPKAPPGVKGRRLYISVKKARVLRDEKGANAIDEIKTMLAKAQARYKQNEN